ncbi:DNA cytosine methyltransferase [Streptococcus agalactiae]
MDPTRLPKADLWTAGSPCQNLSIAGKRCRLIR